MIESARWGERPAGGGVLQLPHPLAEGSDLLLRSDDPIAVAPGHCGGPGISAGTRLGFWGLSLDLVIRGPRIIAAWN